MKTGKVKIPHPLRKTGRKAAEKAQRRIEAEARNAAWNELTVTQQAVILSNRPGKCGRQWEKIKAKALLAS